MEESDRLKNFELSLLNKKNDDQGNLLSHYFSEENVGNQNQNYFENSEQNKLLS